MSDPTDAEALMVRPGDTLIVRVDGRGLNADLAEKTRAELVERLPGVDVLVIGCDQIVVYRPDKTEEAK